jgi:hypothetical protein
MGQWWVWHARRPINFRLARLSGRVHGSGPLLVAIGDSHTDPSAAFTEAFLASTADWRTA